MADCAFVVERSRHGRSGLVPRRCEGSRMAFSKRPDRKMVCIGFCGLAIKLRHLAEAAVRMWRNPAGRLRNVYSVKPGDRADQSSPQLEIDITSLAPGPGHFCAMVSRRNPSRVSVAYSQQCILFLISRDVGCTKVGEIR